MDFDDYLARHPELDPEIAERFRPISDDLDAEFFSFIMSYVVL
jgi:hypothetical protein